MRLQLRLPQHGLIFHPCVPSKNAGPWGKPRRCKMAVETSSTVHFESMKVGSALLARSIGFIGCKATPRSRTSELLHVRKWISE